MVKLTIYSAKGIRKGSTNLPNNFVEKINLPLLAQAVRVYEDRQHPGLAKAKTRGEITASTRKIYRQKGTGGARHGSISAPIFVGGGVAHGPKGVKRVLSLPKKIKDKALGVALSLKASEGQLLVVDGLDSLKKTKEVSNLINEISKKESLVRTPKFTFAISGKNKNINKVINNINGARVFLFGNLNAYQVYQSGLLVIDKEAFESKNTGKRKDSQKKRKVKK